MSDNTAPGPLREVIKNYTRARKFPQLIGMTPDGKRLMGGPYTYVQFVGGGLVALVLWKTPGIWATGSLMRNIVVFVLITGLTVWGLGKVPLGGRNPLSMVQGASKAAGASAQSVKINGQSPRRPRLRAFSGGVEIIDALAQTPAVNPAPAPAPVLTPPAMPAAVVSRPAHSPAAPRRGAPAASVPATSLGVERLVAMAAAPRPTRERV